VLGARGHRVERLPHPDRNRRRLGHQRQQSEDSDHAISITAGSARDINRTPEYGAAALNFSGHLAVDLGRAHGVTLQAGALVARGQRAAAR
jgi:hypothetical protein